MQKNHKAPLLALAISSTLFFSGCQTQGVLDNALQQIGDQYGDSIEQAKQKYGEERVSRALDNLPNLTAWNALLDDKPVPVNGDCEPTAGQQLMLKLVNEARAQDRFCGEDFYPATSPLVWNCQLEQAAIAHNNDMVQNNFFDHTGSDGLHAGDRIEAAGYYWRSYGENLAAGFDNEVGVINGLLESPGHCRNIMDPSFKEFGSTRATEVEGNEYRSYWTHEYASR